MDAIPLDQVSKIANAGGISARVILDAFDRWLSHRVAEARGAGMDLAFHDREFDIAPGRDPALVGWSHVLLAPGAKPPPGQDWTVYRLQNQGLTHSAGVGVLNQDALRTALEALGYGAYLGDPPASAASGA
ncbi:hypothetical protein [Phenylobacterium sp.]|uniref:hypothetical protein n=1 Tax=Phenylobacterium sp. TaxID=1871053 RepID=UPI003BAD9CF0